jgi:SHS2 domain-containing protein
VAIADCALEIEGSDLNDLFETAARAMAEIMVDPATLPATVERTVSLTAPSLDLLLYDWLSELIYLKDSEQVVFTRVEAEVTREPVCRVVARLWGGRIDRERTGLRADAKAVTFHQFALEPRGEGWYARVVIDI